MILRTAPRDMNYFALIAALQLQAKSRLARIHYQQTILEVRG